MKMEASLVQSGQEPIDLSALGILANALGRCSGGMIEDRKLDLGDCDMTMVVMQALYQDDMDKRAVAGVAPGSEGDTFVALTDGEIHKVTVETKAGKLVASGRVSTQEEYSECEHYVSCANAMSAMSNAALAKQDAVMDGDTSEGEVIVDIASAICHKLSGCTISLIRRNGAIVGGYKCVFNDIKTGEDYAAALDMVTITRLDDKEIAQILESRKMSDADIMASFSQPMGIA